MNHEISMLDLAKILINKIIKTEDYSKYICYIEDRPFNDTRYYISNEKLKNLFFTNVSNYVADKNFQLMSKYEFIKLYFYICNEII